MRLIDADALKEAIKNDMYVVDYGVEGAIYGMYWSGIENAIDEQPTVEQKAGKWLIAEKDRYMVHSVRCSVSVCGYCISWMANYCPNCGARMEVQE